MWCLYLLGIHISLLGHLISYLIEATLNLRLLGILTLLCHLMRLITRKMSRQVIGVGLSKVFCHVLVVVNNQLLFEPA